MRGPGYSGWQEPRGCLERVGQSRTGEGLGQHLGPTAVLPTPGPVLACPPQPPCSEMLPALPILQSNWRALPQEALLGAPSTGRLHTALPQSLAGPGSRASPRPPSKSSCLSVCARHRRPSTGQCNGPPDAAGKKDGGRAGSHGLGFGPKSTTVLRALWVNPFPAWCLRFPVCSRSRCIQTTGGLVLRTSHVLLEGPPPTSQVWV